MATAFQAPDGQALRVQRDGELLLCWPEGRPDRWVAASEEFFPGAVADALDYDAAAPEWLERFARKIVRSV